MIENMRKYVLKKNLKISLEYIYEQNCKIIIMIWDDIDYCKDKKYESRYLNEIIEIENENENIVDILDSITIYK